MLQGSLPALTPPICTTVVHRVDKAVGWRRGRGREEVAGSTPAVWRAKLLLLSQTDPNVGKQRWRWGFPGQTRSYTNRHTLATTEATETWNIWLCAAISQNIKPGSTQRDSSVSYLSLHVYTFCHESAWEQVRPKLRGNEPNYCGGNFHFHFSLTEPTVRRIYTQTQWRGFNNQKMTKAYDQAGRQTDAEPLG